MAENENQGQDSPVIKQMRQQLETVTAERDAARHQLARGYATGAGFDPDDFLGKSVIGEFIRADHDWSSDSFAQVMESIGAKPPAREENVETPPAGTATESSAQPNPAFDAFNRLQGGSTSVDASEGQIAQLQKAIAEAPAGSEEAIALRQQLADTLSSARN